MRWLPSHILAVERVLLRSQFNILGSAFDIGFLEFISQEITSGINSTCGAECEIKLLNAITEPFTQLIIQVPPLQFNTCFGLNDSMLIGS